MDHILGGVSSNGTVYTSDNTFMYPNIITTDSTSGVTSGSTLVSTGIGNWSWADSHSVSFSKQNLEQLFKEFQAGKYTKRYMEVYLELMIMNTFISNLEYLEYKQLLSKEQV